MADSSFVKDFKLKDATVINYEVDGCKFLLQLTDGKKLQPENLAVEFQKDQLKLQMKYHVQNKMNTCMTGEVVHIDFIKLKTE